MQFNTIPSGLAPNIEFFFNDVGQTVAACVTGLVGDARPDTNRAILDTPLARSHHG